MSMQAGSIDADGLARTSDGKLYVTLGTGASVAVNLCMSGITFIKGPSGTMGNNGAVTWGTALPGAYADGAYVWMKAGDVAAGVPASAGWYWYVGSSTTVGTVYNSTYSSGTPAIGVATAFVTTGAGAITGDTGSVTAMSFTAPAMGINGRYDAKIAWTLNSTAGSKTVSARYGTASLFGITLSTQTAAVTEGYAQNKGVQNRQITAYTHNMSVGSGSSTSTASTVDSSTTQTGLVLLQCSVATDFVILESYRFSVTT